MINFPRQGLQNPLTLSSFTLQSLLLGLLLLILTHTLQTLLLVFIFHLLITNILLYSLAVNSHFS
ncbi:hypothetical protein GLOIN_2v1666708 [Rhizophagus irregularis DAOM 181602=DAOM 197198]|uniref:Uncharacterized protein n=2 Tax=Rhizophagus irregularis TaxID=588596 RepID=A0A2P4PJ98_RHIID|nr:hypothetical protein GLOIN_2v1666708 [Rhizophagus irregularis DAOM 181602=DAOM 197198]POG65450.1 hypothetical protein GLOIN_2v1666708 [Rhizophagus irregularis DAOM 181602=DAOM 197198]|eukprot:XP_025172316.1 hypothetical protein GLOIN_2v1666708 [Rhizophagus irregularis DAOM 181602=DAOM 197198]